MMKKITLTILMLFIYGIVFAQNFSIGLNYSELINGKNYESASMYTLEGDYEFIENNLSAGFSASVIDSRINNNFIRNPPQDNPSETSFKLGLHGKYYPFLFEKGRFTLKPFIGIELGVYTSSIIKRYLNIPGSREELYSFDAHDKFYTNLSVGSIIFPNNSLSLMFGLKYQLNNFTIKYEKPNSNNEPISYTNYTEKVNLNMLLWSLGVKINF